MPTQDIGAIYTPSIFGRTSFPLQHKGDPIFFKKFDAANSAIVSLPNDTIYIQNHFFKTGEPLKYTFATGSAIGINSSSPGAGSTLTSLPGIVYPVVVDKDRFRVALASSLALSNQYADLTSLGIGTQHSFEAFKQNAKCLISIDNIIQSPISVAATVGIVTYSNIGITVDKIKNIRIGTNIRIGIATVAQEIVKVSAINYATKQLSISRGIEILGTPQINFTDENVLSSYAEILSGNYNIVKDKIFFTAAPLEGTSTNFFISLNDIDFGFHSFSILTNDLKTGSEIFFFSNNPPQELENGKKYYIIRNGNNNFSLAATFVDSLNGVKIQFTNQSGNLFPVDGFQLFAVSSRDNSNFEGRVFLKSNYDGNYVFDDLSEQFTGITSSFELKVSGISTVGIKSDNGIVLINNVFQYPEFDEAFVYEEGVGITSITFLGSAASKPYDVNVKGLPRGGIIISYGSTGGFNYQPLVAAAGTAIVSAGGTIESVSINTPGSGYRSGITTYYVTFDDGEGNGSGALGEAQVSNGQVVSVGIITGGSGYLAGLSTYTARFDPPIPYENVPLSGSAAGIGASVSFEITPQGSIEKLIFSNRGYNYRTEEILTPVGILTSASHNPATDQLKIDLQEVAKDDFSAWNIGILQKLDDLTSKVNGRRKVFTLTETINNKSRRVSLESEVGSEIELAYNLLVFVNDVLQTPNKSYTFTGGSQITFSEAIPTGSTLKVYFYKGASTDAQFFTSRLQIKEGDKLQLAQHIFGVPPVGQKPRTVVRILSSDTLRTEVYDDIGISASSDQLRSIAWTPQNRDLIINGEFISKAREQQESGITSFTKLTDNIIVGINTIGISTADGIFTGINTDVIGINTISGIGSLVQIRDYVEGPYLGIGVTVVSIGSSFVGLSTTSSSPSGTNLTSISFYRVN